MMTVNSMALCDEKRKKKKKKQFFFLWAELELSTQIFNSIQRKIVRHLRLSATQIDFICLK
jgi:hypothetical protein